MLWTSSQMFWHLSQSLVMIQTRVVSKEFLNQSYQRRVSLRSLNIKQNLLASKGGVHSLLWRKKNAGFTLRVWNASYSASCHRGRWTLNLSPSLCSIICQPAVLRGEDLAWVTLCGLDAVASVFSGSLSLYGSVSPMELTSHPARCPQCYLLYQHL